MLFLVWRSWLWIKASSSRGLKEVFPHIYGDHVYQIVGHGLRYSVVVWRWGEMRWSACTLWVFCLETWRAESSHLKYIFIICIKESRFTSASLTAELVGGGEEEELWGRKSNSKVEELLWASSVWGRVRPLFGQRLKKGKEMWGRQVTPSLSHFLCP